MLRFKNNPVNCDRLFAFVQSPVGEIPFTGLRNVLSTEILFDYAYRRAPYRYRQAGLPIGGDLFYTDEGTDVLYLILSIPDPRNLQRVSTDSELEMQLEIGFVGDEPHKKALANIKEIVSEFLSKEEIQVDWNISQPANRSFLELRQRNTFFLASDLTKRELQLAQQLEEMEIRNIAIVIKRSGGILMNDLIKKSNIEPDQVESVIKELSRAGLIAQEYVVICRKTSNQINRVESKDKIEKMKEIGVLCSCGNPIEEERIEELFSPTPMLQKMLNGSYWMTARLVRVLKELNIPDDRILLNLQEGAEEIDAFVDLEDKLLMFELKDNEFSMGHAYPFGGRIGLYKPDVAIIVSTKGIGPEVKDYFERVKPSAEIIYIGSLTDLDTDLYDVVVRTRAQRIQELMSQFEPMTNVNIPVAQVMATKLGIESLLPGEEEIPF